MPISTGKANFSTYQHSLIINLCKAHFTLFLHAQNRGYNLIWECLIDINWFEQIP
jgi:hypothetical protein